MPASGLRSVGELLSVLPRDPLAASTTPTAPPLLDVAAHQLTEAARVHVPSPSVQRALNWGRSDCQKHLGARRARGQPQGCGAAQAGLLARVLPRHSAWQSTQGRARMPGQPQGAERACCGAGEHAGTSQATHRLTAAPGQWGVIDGGACEHRAAACVWRRPATPDGAHTATGAREGSLKRCCYPGTPPSRACTR